MRTADGMQDETASPAINSNQGKEPTIYPPQGGQAWAFACEPESKFNIA
jgi:hypothetical protein